MVCFVVGGNIASSWAVLQCMGEDGYMDIARRLMLVAERMKNGINAIKVKKILVLAHSRADGPCILLLQGLFVCGTPHMTILSFSSSDDQLSIFAIADIMEEKGDLNHVYIFNNCYAACMYCTTGWKIERQLDSLHCTLLPSHTLESADQFITQLQEACSRVKVHHFYCLHHVTSSQLVYVPSWATYNVCIVIN